MKGKVRVLDYGTGNLNSVMRILSRIGASVSVSSVPAEITGADKIILPGVGHFGNAMAKLRELGLIDSLSDLVLNKRKPILGICLGMEIMAQSSEEGNSKGLGWLDAEAVRFAPSDSAKFKVPHMGWNNVRAAKPSALMQGIDASDEFYFAHSYHLRLNSDADLLSETEYDIAFPSAIEKENIFGVQFHPEKSHDAGVRLLKNFIDI